MVSAFGSTQAPTSAGIDVVDCANKLAKFVIDNQFDGVDIDWEDTPAFNRNDSSGENWLINITTLLRERLGPGRIITHAPQAPYFSKGLYPKGGYLTVDQQVGYMIDFYNVQFYNQGVGTYDNAERLFNVSGDWAPYSSINEITTIGGVPASKVVLGKPATTADGNNGWMSAADLNAAIKAAYAYNGWNTGIMFWQFTSDLDGSMCNNSTAGVFMRRDQSEL
jgi:chitinase